MQAFMKGNFFNMDLAVKDSNGEDKLLYIETETEDLTEKAAYLVDGDGNQMVAPSGDYTDESGKVIVIVDGVVKEVKDAVDRTGVEDFAGWVLDDVSDPDSNQGLRYEQFIAPLVKAVQELTARITALEAQLTTNS